MRPGGWEFAPVAAKEFRRLDPPVRHRVLAALDRLAVGDPALDVKRLKGGAESRLRVGDWRRTRAEARGNVIDALRVPGAVLVLRGHTLVLLGRLLVRAPNSGTGDALRVVLLAEDDEPAPSAAGDGTVLALFLDGMQPGSTISSTRKETLESAPPG